VFWEWRWQWFDGGWLQTMTATDRAEEEEEVGTERTATMMATTGDRRAAGRFGQVGDEQAQT
jgi:hypothetical protein